MVVGAQTSAPSMQRWISVPTSVGDAGCRTPVPPEELNSANIDTLSS